MIRPEDALCCGEVALQQRDGLGTGALEVEVREPVAAGHRRRVIRAATWLILGQVAF